VADWVLVDTDILVDAGRAVADAIACLEQIEKHATLAISVVTEMELVVGCRDKSELRALDRFLARFKTIGLNEQISEKCLALLRQYRLSHGLLIADALIAATALSLDSSLATKNARDYRFISELDLLSYPKPFAE